MFKALHQLFDQLKTTQGAATETIDEDLAIAALLIEIATADGHFDAQERQALSQLLERQFHCSPETTESLIKKAQASHDTTVSLFSYTRIVKQAPQEKRVHLIEALWHIAYADGVLDPYEEASIRKVADLLYVSHSDFVRTKLIAQDALKS